MAFINESERHAANMVYLQNLGLHNHGTEGQKMDNDHHPTPIQAPSKAIEEHLDVLKKGLRDAKTNDVMWAFMQIKGEVLDIMREAITSQNQRYSSAERLVKEYQGFLNECVK